MKMEPVESSWIESVGHDPATGTLRIKTKRGETYEYHGVNTEKHKALMEASSAGQHFGQHLKSHPYRKLS
jgi:hypothetical protein